MQWEVGVTKFAEEQARTIWVLALNSRRLQVTGSLWGRDLALQVQWPQSCRHATEGVMEHCGG